VSLAEEARKGRVVVIVPKGSQGKVCPKRPEDADKVVVVVVG